MSNKIIGFDFGGVLDVKNSFLISDNNLTFRTIAQMDTDKAYLLFNLVVENGCKVFCISDLSQYVNMWKIVLRKILSSTDPLHHEAAEMIRNNKREFYRYEIVVDGKNKQSKIDEIVLSNKDATVICFEDEYSLNNCSHIWISKVTGLTEQHVVDATNIFKEKGL